MCMCEKPTVNGEPGYSWNGESIGVRPLDPPALADGDVLLYDLPGRCGGLDGHCHHFRLVRSRAYAVLLVRHGGGDERIPLGGVADVAAKRGAWEALDHHQRYWMLYAIYAVQRAARDDARESERSRWMQAAAEKRIRTRRSKGRVEVWIDDAIVAVRPHTTAGEARR